MPSVSEGRAGDRSLSPLPVAQGAQKETQKFLSWGGKHGNFYSNYRGIVERCVYCSYEMGEFELYTKSVTRELFNRDKFLYSTCKAKRLVSKKRRR